MDDYLAGPRGLSDAIDTSIPASPGSSIAGSSRGTSEPAALSQISLDIAAISSSMLTRRDKSEMVAKLRAVIREEIAAVRADLTALEHRVDALDAERLQNSHRQQAAELATTRQGNLLLDLCRQVEDLDNRGRRNNIRIRGYRRLKGSCHTNCSPACSRTCWGRRHQMTSALRGRIELCGRPGVMGCRGT
ncbi:Hypothetical predicted protein [Pelobates cultripes]|uniref:Uncharacterized protein n=1 Tax=Pelobates cultripes TaxID=61616 RepID=A0AAD1SXK5_PELCU|nr:Hypothetical predicted protein [Pelobates cultripes]